MEPKQKIFVFILLAGICGVFYYLNSDYYYKNSSSYNQNEIQVFDSSEKNKNEYFEIEVSGAVNKPGIFKYYDKIKICDVIEDAEGLKPDAFYDTELFDNIVLDKSDTLIIGTRINSDTTKIRLDNYTVGNLTKFLYPESIKKKSDSSEPDLININTANINMLMTLPRIGRKTAEHIINYREQNDGFKSVTELKNIPRIGEKSFLELKDKVAIK